MRLNSQVWAGGVRAPPGIRPAQEPGRASLFSLRWKHRGGCNGDERGEGLSSHAQGGYRLPRWLICHITRKESVVSSLMEINDPHLDPSGNSLSVMERGAQAGGMSRRGGKQFHPQGSVRRGKAGHLGSLTTTCSARAQAQHGAQISKSDSEQSLKLLWF